MRVEQWIGRRVSWSLFLATNLGESIRMKQQKSASHSSDSPSSASVRWRATIKNAFCATGGVLNLRVLRNVSSGTWSQTRSSVTTCDCLTRLRKTLDPSY